MQLHAVFALVLFAAVSSPLVAQAPAAPKVTTVMATLTVKSGISRDEMMKVMRNEVRDTVQLYLDGKIRQWFARGDGKGVVFFVDCTTVEEAKSILEKLPLLQGNFATFDYMPLGPLSPLQILLRPAGQ